MIEIGPTFTFKVEFLDSEQYVTETENITITVPEHMIDETYEYSAREIAGEMLDEHILDADCWEYEEYEYSLVDAS